MVVVRYIADRDISLVKFRYLDKEGYIRCATIAIKGRLNRRNAREELLNLLFS